MKKNKQFETSIFPNGQVEKIKTDQATLSSLSIEVVHVFYFLLITWFIIFAFKKRSGSDKH